MYELIQESADNVRGEQQAAVRLIDTGRKSNRVRYLSEPYDSAVWSHRCPDELPLVQAFYEMVEDILGCKEHDRDKRLKQEPVQTTEHSPGNRQNEIPGRRARVTPSRE